MLVGIVANIVTCGWKSNLENSVTTEWYPGGTQDKSVGDTRKLFEALKLGQIRPPFLENGLEHSISKIVCMNEEPLDMLLQHDGQSVN